jgi:hypothetical protein
MSRAIFLLALGLMACTPADTPAPPDAAGPPAPAESTCPKPTDGCMNEDNYQSCLEAEAKCPGKVLIMESCPLQFACED